MMLTPDQAILLKLVCWLAFLAAIPLAWRWQRSRHARPWSRTAVDELLEHERRLRRGGA